MQCFKTAHMSFLSIQLLNRALMRAFVRGSYILGCLVLRIT